MDVALTFTALLLVALLVEPLARWLHLPFAAALVSVGFVGSELIVALGFDTGLRWHHFTWLILDVFVPVLVFESAFNLRARDVFRNLAVIVYLAVPMVVVATFAMAALVYFGINHPAGFPWIVALLTGALLSATDPLAVTSLVKRLRASHRLHTILEGEASFNDATAILLFSVLLSISAMPQEAVGVLTTIGEFMRVFCGGLGVGLAIGAPALLLMRMAPGAVARAIMTLAAALFSFYLAEHVFHVSGVMAVLVAGLLAGEAHRRLAGGDFVATLWELNGYIANALIFLLVGVTITIQMFTDRWLAMLIGIAAALVVRLAVVFVLLPPLQWLPRVPALSLSERTILFWGGLRGAVTLALALSLPLELEAWWTVQSIAYGVVLFALFVQAPTTGLLVKWLRVS